MDHEARARALLELYDAEIKPLLEEHRVVSIDALDQMRAVLAQALARSPTLSVGFVGASQVGKSSIINALLGQRVVPAGGIGPLTAQATTIAYRDVNAMEVKYHGAEELDRLRRGLTSYLKKRGELEVPVHVGGAETPPNPPEAPSDADVDVMLDAELAHDETAPEEGGARRTSSVGEHMLSQVLLMLQRPGDPPETVRRVRELPHAALLEAVRVMAGHEARPGAGLDPEIQTRAWEVRRVLGRNESIFEAEGGNAEFRAELRLRAALWRSPLVARLRLHLRQPFLRELSVVDLPGVGNVADPGADVARDFVSQAGAGALVVVFRNNGLTQEVVDILDRAGVFTRLLWGGRGGRPPIRIVVAVTYVDAVAQTRYDEIVAETGEAPDAEGIFRACAAEMTDRLRDDLRKALEASGAYRDAGGSLAEREAAVKKVLAAAIDVIVVDAKDYLQIKEKQPRGRFLDDEEATNVPRLKQILSDVARAVAGDRQEAIAHAFAELHAAGMEATRLLAAAYEQGGGRRTAEWRRFRERLGAFAEPVRAEVSEGRARAMAELHEAMPLRLDAIGGTARENAAIKLQEIRRHGETLYWPSLNAALRRGGTWDGQRLDYPGSLTRALVDTVAAAWEPSVVEAVRGVVQRLSEAEVGLVERVCAEARRIDASLVADDQIEGQKRILMQQASAGVRWTDERLEALREEVQATLRGAVAGPIAEACEQSIARGTNRGRGASRRILDTFQAAGTLAIDQAAGRARELLQQRYRELLDELEGGYLRPGHDPVGAAIEAFAGAELLRAAEVDEAARDRVVRRAKVVREQIAAAA
jgi:hypothetical protein